jgi:hypothetical protein
MELYGYYKLNKQAQRWERRCACKRQGNSVSTLTVAASVAFSAAFFIHHCRLAALRAQVANPE